MSQCNFNESKFAVLDVLFNATEFLTPEEIAIESATTFQKYPILEITKLSLKAVQNNLTRLTYWSYIHRKRENKQGKKNYYMYRHLKPKGYRVYFKLVDRVKISQRLGIRIPLDIKKPITNFIPRNIWLKYQQELGV